MNEAERRFYRLVYIGRVIGWVCVVAWCMAALLLAASVLTWGDR